MDKSVQVFNFEEQKIDVIEIEGNPWFIGKQVAGVLGYKDTKKAIKLHVEEDDKQLIDRSMLTNGVVNRETNYPLNNSTISGINTKIIIINESGLYSLIFSSKLESAKKFNRWVTHEVLPSIRKTGKYEVKQSREERIASVLAASQELIAELTQNNQHLQKTVEIMAPKAHFWDKFADSEGHVQWRDACNLIRCPDGTIIKENVIRNRLIEEGWIYKPTPNGYRPYKNTIDAGYMVVKLAPPDKYGRVFTCNFFTADGMQKLLEMFSPTENDFEEDDY